MPRRRYIPVEKCRSEIREYIYHLEAGTDDADSDMRSSGSTDRYKQDLRWFDMWLDGALDRAYRDEETDWEVSDPWIESVQDLTEAQANKLGRNLSNNFSGTTGTYRWNRIHSFYGWADRMGMVDGNPLEKWDEDKKDNWGLTKTTEQSRHIDREEDEHYAPKQDEVRLMEEHVGRHRIRDQLIIRIMWQTGLRRGELSALKIAHMDRDAREIEVVPSVAKYSKRRVVAYQPSLDPLLEEWLDYGLRAEMTAGRDHDYLVCGERGGQLSGDRINTIVVNAACDAGLNEKLYADASAPIGDDGEPKKNRWKITAHNLRHGYGTYLVNKTDAGIWEVSKQMGHSSVDITEDIYVEDDPRAGIEHSHEYGPD